MDLQNLFAAQHVGVGHHDLAVETAGTQQRGVEHVGAVGGRDQNHAFVGLEAVHFDQQLVERLFAFVVAAAETGAAMAAHGVDFVDEDDAGRVFLALFEHVAHAAGADADEHFDEIGAGNGEERHVCLAGDRAGQQRLTSAGRADQQHALRYFTAEALKLLRVAQELDDLFQFLFRFLDAGDVVERHPSGALGQQPGFGFAEAHRLAAAALHLAHEENPDADQQQHREPGNQDIQQRRRPVVGRRRVDDHAGLVELVDQVGIVGRIGRERPAVLAHTGNRAALDRDLVDLAALNVGEECGIRNAGLTAAARRLLEQIEQRKQQKKNDRPEGYVFTEIVQ